MCLNLAQSINATIIASHIQLVSLSWLNGVSTVDEGQRGDADCLAQGPRCCRQEQRQEGRPC